MKDFFLKDSVLKVISFVIALLLWIYIIAVVDPSVDVTVKDIPIRYTNEDQLTEKGLCLVSDKKDVVELKIRGSRKRIANIDNKNIYATVDLSNINKTGTFSVPIAISIPYEYNEIVNKKPYNLDVLIDEIVTAERDIKVMTTGSTANGYIASSPIIPIGTVELTGARSLIESIKNVGVLVDFDGRAADIKDTEKLFFIGKDDKRIDGGDFIYDLVKMSEEEITVEFPVYRLKTVPVKADIKGTGNIEDYKVSLQLENVTIYASNEILDEVEEIWTEPIMVSQMENQSKSIGLKLPEGVFLRDGISEISVKVEKRG